MLRTIRVPNDAPRDIFRAGAHVLTFEQVSGFPLPGEIVDLYQPGEQQPILGVVSFVNFRTQTLGVEPDFQTIYSGATRQPELHRP